MNICIVAGARPNFIKVAPIVRAVENAKAHGRDVDYTLVYAGSKDDPTLEASLFDDLQIAPPQVYLNVVCENLNELTGQVMSAFERYLQENKTDAVIVVDDLASTMAAAIVTKKQGIRLAHLVAGTRSFDIKMPKEINRLVIDGLSDLLFTAGMGANSIATREGAELSKIYTVGNILMDTLRFNLNRLKKPAFMDAYKEREYLVFTLNRHALLADRDNLCSMIKAMVENAQGMPIPSLHHCVEKLPRLWKEFLPTCRTFSHRPSSFIHPLAIWSLAGSRLMPVASSPTRAMWQRRQLSTAFLVSR